MEFPHHEAPYVGPKADVAALMSRLQRRVLEHSGVWLEPEIEWWGDGEPPEAFRGRPAA